MCKSSSHNLLPHPLKFWDNKASVDLYFCKIFQFGSIYFLILSLNILNFLLQECNLLVFASQLKEINVLNFNRRKETRILVTFDSYEAA